MGGLSEMLVKFFIISLLKVSLIDSKIVESERCGRFTCPDNCVITYEAGCPLSCDCGRYVKCPKVTCPAPEPICSIHTLLDGCQTCACRLPYALIQKESENDIPSFVFLDSNDFRRQLDDRTIRRGQKVMEEHFCTLTMMEKIDQCMDNMMQFDSFLKSKRRDAVFSLNPTVRPQPDDMHQMCGMMGGALKCMGAKAYQMCRRTHKHLSEMDAIYGYPCGSKEHLFMAHMDCIQDSHREDFRINACEDQAVRSLAHIAQGGFPMKEKRRQKCDALTWLMGCERPSVARRCSDEAADVYMESMQAAVDYVAPECVHDYERQVFMPKEEETPKAREIRLGEQDNGILLPKEELSCAPAQMEEIDTHLGKLYEEILELRDRASLSYPIGFWYKQDRLRRVCKVYNDAMKNIKAQTKRDCYENYETFDVVHYTLFYPCGYATRSYFKRYFQCLTDVRRLGPVRDCEFLAHQRLEDPTNDVCETYDVLLDCMHDPIVRECGYDGFELEYQYANMDVKKHSKDCSLRRIFRFVDVHVEKVREI